MSRDSLRNLVGLNGEFVGTTDSQILTNKTANVQLNTIIQTTPALGTLLKDDGTKFSPLARGSAGLPLRVNDAGTDVGYSAIGVAGGGTGATSLTGVVIGTGTTAMTTKSNPAGAFLDDSSAQNVTGAKTFSSTTFLRRNPAGTFSLTEIHPAITANKDRRFYQPYNFLVYSEGGTTYVLNGLTNAVDNSSSTATTMIQWALDNLTASRTTKEVVKVIGPYSITTLTMPSYTLLDLRDARLTQAAATNLNLLINNDTSGGNTQIEIAGGILDGNKANQTADGTNYDTRNTVNLTKVTDSSVHDCHIVNSNSNAVFVGQSTNIKITSNNMVTPRKCGVRVDATSSSTAGAHVNVVNNYFYDLPESFFTACTTTDTLFQNNLCDICATNGVNITAPRTHILNNIIRTCDRAGVTFGGEASPFGAGDYSEVIGNTIWECKGGGIFNGVTQGGDYVTIAFNTIKGHPSLQDTASGRAYGIRCRGRYCVIQGNQVWGWLRTGISITGVNSTSSFDSRLLESARILVKDNICHTNGQLGATEATSYLKGGIAVFGTGSETAYNTNIRITGNICYNNTDYGILFRNSTGTIIEDNDLSGNVTGAISNVASNV